MDHYVSNYVQAGTAGNVLKIPFSANYWAFPKFSSIACNVIILLILLFAAVVANNAVAGQLTLAWHPNSEPHLAGYKLHYGETSRNYTSTVDIGNKTNYTVSNLKAGKTYYFAVSAYDTTGNVKSDLSNEVSAIIPISYIAPTANFSASSTSGTVPFRVNFSDKSTGDVTNWTWNFGDGISKSGQSVSHTYQAPGTYAVSLSVRGPGGEDTKAKTAYITVAADPSDNDDSNTNENDDVDGGSNVYQQESGPHGLLTIEAENFSDNVPQASHKWILSIDRKGFLGSGAMRAAPDTGARYDSDYIVKSPRLDFKMNFVKSGTHYVWLRGLSTGSDNSVHMGLDGQATNTDNRINFKVTRNWTWSSDTMGGVRAKVNIATPGEHTLNLWMREDGLRLDRIVLTTDANFMPSDMGPAESAKTVQEGPTANFSASSTSGTVPFIVTFKDTSIGNVDTRSWNFGDGGTSTGQTAVYTYKTDGIFTVNLTVKGPNGTNTETRKNYITVLANRNDDSTDGQDTHDGGSDDDSTTDDNPEEAALIEANEVKVDHQWKRITFSRTFVDPVVIAKPLSFSDNDPAVIRIRNVDNTGFDIRIQEWEYLDGIHDPEMVSYLAMERGSHTLADGTRVEAGQLKTKDTGSFSTVTFNEVFQTKPVVLTAVTSFQGGDAVVTRMRNINTADFQVKQQKQEANTYNYQAQTISYIAWEPSKGTVDDVVFEVNRTAKTVSHKPHRIAFQEIFMDIPVFLADMQTKHGGDTSNIRWENKDTYSVDVHINEERSKDSETNHVTEEVGYMLISPIQQ